MRLQHSIDFARADKVGPHGVATGALRMAADMHWFTDVTAGALIGTGLGVAVPLILHPRRDAPASVLAVPILTDTFVGFAARGAWN